MSARLAKPIPVSVIIVTKNEAHRLARCLEALEGFSEIVVVDSASTDQTADIAGQFGARVEIFIWNGLYPKKRQWCLDHLKLAHDFVFFVDADEIVTPELKKEIAALDFSAAGYFVRGRYVMKGRVLRRGLHNNKLALLDRRKMEFPVVDDLGLPGMGEIEGHYQPVLKSEHRSAIFQLQAALLHEAYADKAAWQARHLRYAAWEAGMNSRKAWPHETSKLRSFAKVLFRALPLRPFIAFLHSYVFKCGFLDGVSGFEFALSRAAYYRMISDASKAPAYNAAAPSSRSA